MTVFKPQESAVSKKVRLKKNDGSFYWFFLFFRFSPYGNIRNLWINTFRKIFLFAFFWVQLLYFDITIWLQIKRAFPFERQNVQFDQLCYWFFRRFSAICDSDVHCQNKMYRSRSLYVAFFAIEFYHIYNILNSRLAST